MKVHIPEESIVSICKRLTELADGQVNVRDGYTAYQSGVSMFYSRHVITATDDSCAAQIVKTIDEHRKAGGPQTVSYTEDICGKGFAAELERHGFTNFANQTGMYLDLADHTLTNQNNEKIVVIRDNELEQWSRVCEVAFDKPSELPALRYWIHDRECRFYAYKLDGKIVATALAHEKRGHCGIHEVGTLPDYRGRGICLSLINRILDDAKSGGAKVVSLQASEAGASIYARAGLKKVSVIPGWMHFEH